MNKTVLQTRTGGIPIGFRRGWSDWQKDLPALAQWASQHGFACLDLGNNADTVGPQAIEAGLALGSVDLPAWKELISANPETRARGAAAAKSFIERCAAFGPTCHFTVMLPEDPNLPRADNFRHMVAGYALLQDSLLAAQARIVIEGWPGPGALCCTPETYRSFFEACPAPCFGINYDPSHLLRMGVDPIRFLQEFKNRVFHMHGKDTELFPDALYEYGTEQPPAFFKGRGFGSATWRYTIPGHGSFRWIEAFRILADNHYSGRISIELEDADYNGSETGEKAGLLAGASFLAAC